jgi:hypothetical protein
VTTETPPPQRRSRVSVGAFIVGFVVALVLNFVLAVFALSTTNPLGPSAPSIVAVLTAWLVSIGIFALLYRWHPWAAYGAIGCYAALFFLLLIGGGAFGPYACFRAYGYPGPQ